jgi:hypothetical protein
MWIHHNGVDHAVDEQGLPFCLSRDVEAAIHEEFHKGPEGLSQQIFTLFIKVEIMLCLYWQQTNRAGSRVFNWLEILRSLLPLLTDNSNN